MNPRFMANVRNFIASLGLNLPEMFRLPVPRWLPGLLGLLALLGPTAFSFAAAIPPTGTTTNRDFRILWNPTDQKLEARVLHQKLESTLLKLARATGWSVLVEPGANPEIHSAFRPLPVHEALPRLFGDLNYALLQKTNGTTQLLVYRSSADAATQAVSLELGRIANELIVSLRPGETNRINELAKKLGARIAGRLDDRGVYRLEFENEASAEAAKNALRNDPEIASLENNYRWAEPDMIPSDPGMGIPPLNLKPKPGNSGSKTILAILDSTVRGLPDSYQSLLLPQKSVSEGTADPSTLSHGTAMTATALHALAAVEKSSSTSVQILPVDIFGAQGTTTSWEMARGIITAVESGAKVINLSVGGPENSPYLGTLIHNVSADGVLFVASAGNQPVNTPNFPAAYPEVLSVTATGRNGQLEPYANFGSFVKVAAPGYSLVPYEQQTWRVTGTSPAAARISGYAAGLAAQPGSTPAGIAQAIQLRYPFRIP